MIDMVFGGGVYVAKNTSQAANVRAQRVRCSGLVGDLKGEPAPLLTKRFGGCLLCLS